MKKLCLLILTCGFLISSAQNEQLNIPTDLGSKSLLTINGKSVEIADFWYVFSKNLNSKDEINTEAVESYLELFKNFKLKVEAANAADLMNKEAVQTEFNTYKKQLEESYLNDKNANELLVTEAYERSLYSVEASHILIASSPFDIPSDTLKAYRKAQDIRKNLVNGEDFATLALKHSEDPSVASNNGYLGHFTVFQMVYPFESGAYQTKVGEISNLVRTNFGYHILKVHDKVRIPGSIKIAHIMVVHPQNNPDGSVNEEEAIKKEQKIKEIYTKLIQQEGTFEDLAKKYSEHSPSASKGGELPEFTGFKYDPIFVKTAYSIEEKGTYTAPFKSEYGWHIIKLLDLTELPSYEEQKRTLANKVQRSDRSTLPKKAFINRLKRDYTFKENPKNFEVFYTIVDSTIIEGKWLRPKKPRLGKKVVFTIQGKKYTQRDLATYLENNQAAKAGGKPSGHLLNLYNQWVEEILVALEREQLAQKYPQFKNLLKEYEEGIVLFEITNQEVWSKAMKDSIGLQNFHEQIKNQYLWDKRIEADVYKCNSEETALKVYLSLKNGMAMDEILKETNQKSQLNLSIEQATFELATRPEIQKEITLGINPIQEHQGSFYVYNVLSILEKSPKALNEIKGLITAAYQEHLMGNWLVKLNDLYPIEVNDENWKALLKHVSSLESN